jgi:phenylacetate-coenzyme A ligase PaaK-like adenylate-forming protein
MNTELVPALMDWHFDPATGSPFWLQRAKSLDFDPRRHVRSFADLHLFPNVTDELRDVPAEALIPRGFGDRPEVVGVIESGGTTGAPKRIPLLGEFADRLARSEADGLAAAGVSKTAGWLAVFPSGPHGALDQMRRAARAYGDGILVFAVDLDPRWVKKQAGHGNTSVVDAYTEHVVDQVAYVLQSQNVEMLRITPPLLARLARRDDLVDLIRRKIRHITWGGAHLDADSRYFYRTELFPQARISGRYGTTMALGAGGVERPGLDHDDPCIFDPTIAPYVTFSVVDSDSGESVAHGERGQLVVHHLSKSFLLPNNAERDTAIRIPPVDSDQVGDSVADIEPLREFRGAQVVEGVY